jgi:RecB family exonuclease
LSLSEYERTVLLEDPRVGDAYLASRYATFARARMAWSARWRNRNLTAWDGVLAPELQAGIIRRAGVAQAISATRLEDYAACPYRFFLKSVLRLSPIEEPELIERIAALDRGSLVHTVLRAFMARCGPDDPPRAGRAAVHRTWLREIAEQECREIEERGQVGYPLLWEFEKTSILEDLDAWYDREAADLATHQLRPGAFELRFGPKWAGRPDAREDSPLSVEVPVPVTVGDATLRFQGRIDRIDWDPERTSFRVIDYKTGRSTYYKDERFEAGTRLQLPLYLLAASHALHTHDIDIPWEQGEAQYFFATRRGEMKRVRFSGQTLAGRRADFERLLGMLAERISSGDFHPEPGLAGGTCTYCDCKPACDSRVARIALRKSESRHPDFTWLAEVE